MTEEQYKEVISLDKRLKEMKKVYHILDNNDTHLSYYKDCSWEILVRCLQITQWLYAEDLLPKEGGDGK
jgi:hypothetical protein